MDEAKHNLVLVTYTNVEPFLKLLKTNTWLVRLDRLESNQPHPAGCHITPYVIVQLRIGDELHLLKLIGETYDYWGDQFEDHPRVSQSSPTPTTLTLICTERLVFTVARTSRRNSIARRNL